MDTNQIAQLIGLAYEAALDDAAWRFFANAAVATFGSRLATIRYQDHENPDKSFVVSGGLDGFESLYKSTPHNGEDDPFWVAIRDKPAGTVRLGSDVVGPGDLHRNRLYSAVSMPWQLEHFLFGAITTGSGVSAYFFLARSRQQAAFVANDKDLISQLLLTHLRRSITLQRDAEAIASRNALLSAALDQAPYGLVVFDFRGRPVVVNQVAAGIFSAGDGLALRNGALHATDPAVEQQLAKAMSSAMCSARSRVAAAPEPVLIARPSNPQPYKVMLAPLILGSDQGSLPAGSAVVALIQAGRLRNASIVSAVLANSYDLSRAESRLCQALLTGQTLVEAAIFLDITRNTAKTHLARIFDKTGVRSQAALLRLLALGAGANLPILKGPSIKGSGAEG